MEETKVPLVMITKDRSPKQNYVFETINNLEGGKVFESKYFHSLTIIDDCSDPEYSEAIRLYAKYVRNLPITVVRGEQVAGSKGNAERAHRLLHSLSEEVYWGMVMEDDIDVCSNFLQSCVKWVREYDDPRRHLFFMALPDAPKTSKKNFFEMDKLWGSQCYMVRTEESKSIADFLQKAGPKTNGHDTKINRWQMETFGTYKYACSPAPTYVQHIGLGSAIHAGVREKAHPHFNFIGRD